MPRCACPIWPIPNPASLKYLDASKDNEVDDPDEDDAAIA